MKKKQTIKYIVCDLLSAMMAWTLLFAFRKVVLEDMGFDDVNSVYRDLNYWLGLVAVPAGWLLLYAMQGTYRDVLRKARVNEFLNTALASLIGVVVIFFVLLIDDNIATYRNYYASFFFLLVVHFVLTYVPRMLITSHTARLVHSRRLGFPTLMVGSGHSAYQTFLDLENQETYSGERFVGFVSIDSNEAIDPQLANIMPCVGVVDDMRELMQRYDIEEAIVALEQDGKDRVNEILRAIEIGGDVLIKITPDERDLIVGSVRQESIFHSPLIVINNRLMPEWQYSLKRLFDIVISLLALVVLSPVFLITAIIVKCTSPGPVFYAQERIGYKGKPFRMHKFRSMYVNAEDSGPALSKDGDPRITPFGRFMRKVRLDEIPQFYNVLRGTMSIVGPRPERQFYIDQIVKRAPEYLLLQRIKPGITSWGQVKYGYASNVDEMVERLRYDLLYLDNMSLVTDLKIMVYTVIIILQGRGK